MQFLFEEFFKKVFKAVNSINIFIIKILVKIIFFVIIAFLIFKIIDLIIKGEYTILIIIFGLLIFGEFAHYIRKLREKKVETKNFQDNEKNN